MPDIAAQKWIHIRFKDERDVVADYFSFIPLVCKLQHAPGPVNRRADMISGARAMNTILQQ